MRANLIGFKYALGPISILASSFPFHHDETFCLVADKSRRRQRPTGPARSDFVSQERFPASSEVSVCEYSIAVQNMGKR